MNPDEQHYGLPLLSDKTRYWPSEKSRRPDARLIAYALACVEAALKLSQAARERYLEVIEAYSSPEPTRAWESVKHNTATNRPRAASILGRSTAPWHGKELDQREAKRLLTDIDGFIGNVNSMPAAHRAIAWFILKNFNREIDHEDWRWKVMPKTAPALVWALAFKGFVNFLGVDIDVADRQRLGDEADSWFFEKARKPTTNLGRSQRRELHKCFRREKFVRMCDSTLLRWGEIWYRCRVAPGRLVVVQEELVSEREAGLTDDPNLPRSDRIASEKDTSYLSKRIEPFDIAMGYPR
jgi:hypothetical protein